jgi:manganese oxidase
MTVSSIATFAAVLAALPASECSHLPMPTGPTAQLNDNRTPAGSLRGGRLTLDLIARPAVWYPDGPEGCSLNVFALAGKDGVPSIPGPLIRVRAGTRVRVALRNDLEHPIQVGGLQDRPAEQLDSTLVAAGETQVFEFLATTPGSYYYWARMVGSPALGSGVDGQLAGALVVDPPDGGPPDRILVLTRWSPPGHLPLGHLPESDPEARRFELNVINGLSWPHTERLTYTTDDTARLRVINAGGDAHVMHLHGFHYRVTSHGDNGRDVIFPPGEGPMLVSEVLVPGHTLSIEWLPTRPGNWIFHCHLQRHMTDAQRLDRIPGARHVQGRHDAPPRHDMAGLIIGVRVSPGPNYVAENEEPHHRLRLFVNVREGVFGERPGYGFVLQEDEREPAPDSIRIPGATLLLRRGEPTEIVVHNRIGKPLSVHWHGLELDSYFDGVAGWSGIPGGRIATPIAHGDSFAVRITPPRAGTFIYHVHGGGPLDLASGLYGAFVVLAPDRPRALPETDRLFVVSRLPGNDTATVINGTRTPGPVHVRVGVTYRFRIIGIMPQEGDFIALRDPAGIARWDLVARDGVDGDGARGPGLSAGMTLDYALTASRPGEMMLEFETIDLLGHPLQRPIRIPVHAGRNAP